MATNNNTQDEETRGEDESAFDFWSDEGARRFNEIVDEGSVYLSAKRHGFADFEMDSEDLQSEYRDPGPYARNDETRLQGRWS